jgi:branched-chain amino acid transport system permease protein
VAPAGPLLARDVAVTRMALATESRPLAAEVVGFLTRRARWSPLEIAFWLAALLSIWLFPTKHLILTEICIWAMFALSLDLILGYAGIISLGHAAFFGLGAYSAGLIGKYGVIPEPVIALVVSGLIASAVGFATSFLVLRGSDLTRLMVTFGVALILGEIANKFSDITGGADGLQGVEIGPVFGMFRFDMFGHTGYVYALSVLFVMFVLARRIVRSPFGLSLQAIRGNALRSSAVGIAVNWRLVAIYTLAAGYAGLAGAVLAQTQSFASLEMFSIDRSADVLLILIIGGTGYLYGGLIGALIYRFAQDYLSDLTARYWQYWIGFVLIMMVLFGRVYGGVLAALIIWVALKVPVWFDQPAGASYVVAGAALLVLSLVREPVVKWIALGEAQAVDLLRRIRTGVKGRASDAGRA